MESFEERALLSAVPLTSGEYTDLTAKYSALELPGTADELNIITLDLSEDDGLTELKSAIAEAKRTPQSDLIVVRTTADANTITYTASGDRLEIPIDIGAYETGKTALGVPGWSVSVLGGESVCVTLAGVPNASGYMIEYAANADFENAQTQTFTDSGAQTISGIEAETKYFFRVKSIGTGEYADSKWSEAQSLTIQREAESLIVDTVLDVVDAYDGVTSIREAIALAKDGETVTFAESMRDQTIVLNGTPLELTKAVSLDADGLNVTLDGDFESTQTSSDGAGNARVSGKKVDIGAYEFHAAFVETPQAEVMKSGKKLTVTWDAVPGASSYLVEYRDVKTAKWTLKTVKKGTSLAINGNVGTTYEIRVAAVTAYAPETRYVPDPRSCCERQ